MFSFLINDSWSAVYLHIDWYAIIVQECKHHAAYLVFPYKIYHDLPQIRQAFRTTFQKTLGMMLDWTSLSTLSDNVNELPASLTTSPLLLSGCLLRDS